MANDLSLISIVDDLQVYAIQEVVNSSPRTIAVYCRGDANNIRTVKVNEVRINSYTVVGTDLLLVEIGDYFDAFDAQQLSVDLLGLAWTGQRAVQLVFELSNEPAKVSGLFELLQTIIVTLINRPGSNRWRPGSGGGLLNGLGNAIASGSLNTVSSIVSQAVGRTKEEIIAAQAGQTSLDPNERLLNLKLGGLTFDEASRAVRATLELTTYGGTQLAFPLTL